jgi:4-hydroxybenzoate polyprenyltransferase
MPRASLLLHLFRSVRWTDVLVLQGAPVLGVVFSIGQITAAKLAMSIPFEAASVLLTIHVLTLNDWADFTRGIHHSNRAMLQLESRNITPRVFLIFSSSILVAGLLLFLLLSRICFAFAMAIALLGIFYSHPSLNGKSMPIVSTLLHFIGGLLHFLLGYVLFSLIDSRGVLIGTFFGLTFAAGHPVQEARDVFEDLRAGARTNAIVFGARQNFLAGMILFTLQYLYLFWLAWRGLIPLLLAALPILFYPIHISWALATLRGGLTQKGIVEFQTRYRILYALIGLALFLFGLWSVRLSDEPLTRDRIIAGSPPELPARATMPKDLPVLRDSNVVPGLGAISDIGVGFGDVLLCTH